MSHQIIKRAVQHGFNILEKQKGEDGDDKVPKKKLVALTVVIVVGTIGYVLLEYMAALIMKLTIVEAEPSVALPLDAERVPLTTDENPNPTPAPPAKRTTASLCGTFRLLREKFGFFGPFHGFGAYIIYTFAVSIAVGVIDAVVSPFLKQETRPLVSVPISALVTATVAMAYTHAQVGVGGAGVNIFNRTKKITFKKATPTFLPLLVINGIFDIVILVHLLAKKTPQPVLGVLFAIAYVSVVYFRIVLIRQQASGIPSEEETVVKIDRTFGQDIDGDRVLNFKEAAKGLSKDIVRIFVMGVKVYGGVLVYAVAWFSIMFALGLADLWKQ